MIGSVETFLDISGSAPCGSKYMSALLRDFHLGTLHFDQVRREEMTSFEYAQSWLGQNESVYIDPDVLPFAGRQYPPRNKSLFEFIADSE